MSEPLWLVHGRACDRDPEGPAARVNIPMDKPPSKARLREIRRDLIALYREAFGEDPVRHAVVVLPYATDLGDEISD